MNENENNTPTPDTHPITLDKTLWREIFADLCAIESLAARLHRHFEALPNDEPGELDQAEGHAVSRAAWRMAQQLMDVMEDVYSGQRPAQQEAA